MSSLAFYFMSYSFFSSFNSYILTICLVPSTSQGTGMTEGFLVYPNSPAKGLHPDPTHGQIPFYLLGTQHPPSLSVCSFHQRMLGVVC